MSILLTIITPCYNSEATLEATLQSVLDQNFSDWEAIIVNDGSTDSTEDIAINWTQKDSRFKYFSKVNEGLGRARNYGIQKAEGKYILPLDSDNLIEKNFSKKAIEIFKNDSNIGVVHGYAEYFGETEGLWKVEDFDLKKMLISNYIDACAIFKKDLWQKVGGYDENMPYQGHEDWDFWISLGSEKVMFFNLHEVTFKYFVSSTSMIHSFTENMVLLNHDYVVKKHSKLFHKEFVKLMMSIKEEKMRLTSKKVVVNLFCETLFGFTIFKKK